MGRCSIGEWLSSLDRPFNRCGHNFYRRMFHRCIDRRKPDFFSGVEDTLFKRWIFFDRFDRFHGDERLIIGGIGGGDLVEEVFDVFGGLGEVLGIDNFVSCHIIAADILSNHAVIGSLSHIFSFKFVLNAIASPDFVIAHGGYLCGVVDGAIDGSPGNIYKVIVDFFVKFITPIAHSSDLALFDGFVAVEELAEVEAEFEFADGDGAIAHFF